MAEGNVERSQRGSSAPRPPETHRRNRYRLAFRIVAIPVVAIAAWFIYRGLHDRLVLPQCDSERAKKTLAEVLAQLRLEPVGYEPIKTISTSKDQVVCNAVLPLPDGASVVIDYAFYWNGNNVNIRYTISRRSA